MMVKLYAAFGELDATLIEVNPLVVTSERDVVALDSKTTIDNSLGAVPPRGHRGL